MARSKSPNTRTGHTSPATEAPAAPVVHEGRAPRVPAHLGETGREVWRSVWAAGAGAYSPDTDRNVILRYAELHDRRAELMGQVDADGFMSSGYSGQPVAHPLLRYVESTEKELRAIETVIGFTPESRLRLGISAAQVRKSALETFLDL
ncbi:phage terminase small subunit P27 family [Streptomyces caniferus]|uniref:phage terminase small subunit P27 family n=1 Tax=Streptomyces caniferus TaxID=285557 RepID=UPI002E2DBC5D|nr:phage terminase small subunit P27 family [Streptomyces caniferus]